MSTHLFRHHVLFLLYNCISLLLLLSANQTDKAIFAVFGTAAWVVSLYYLTVGVFFDPTTPETRGSTS